MNFFKTKGAGLFAYHMVKLRSLAINQNFNKVAYLTYKYLGITEYKDLI